MREYYYIDSHGAKQGPFDLETMQKMGIESNTKVWYIGLEDWTNACEFEELKGFVTPITPKRSFEKPIQSDIPQNKPDSYLAWSIVSAILCCLPLSIPAIVYAAKVDSLWINKEYEASIDAAKKAKKWTIVSAIVAGGFWLLYILFFVVIGLASYSDFF